MEITVKLRKADIKEFLDDWLDEELYGFESEIRERAGTPSKKDLIEQMFNTGSFEALLKKHLPAQFNDRIYESLDSMFYDVSYPDVEKLIENCETACDEIRAENEAIQAAANAKKQASNRAKQLREARAILEESGYVITKAKKEKANADV